jgi:hypothetical protein
MKISDDKNMSLNLIEELLDAGDVRRILRCRKPFVYKLAAAGALPCVRIPLQCKGEKKKEMVRFLKGDVFNFIKANYQRNN